ncbi:MAG: hypothetical protein KDA45_09430, partial [Planctomycetales bacterium]|nr:hypothetical protein [Planctomycetales bacterium]
MNTRSTAQLNWLGTLLLGTLLWNLGSAVAGGDERPVSFLRDVAPILVQRCEGCHGPQQSESSYRVDTVAYLLAEGDYGEAQVTAGSLEESLLWQLVSTDDGDLRMPKDGEPLPPRELQAIRSWIEQGATVDLPQPEQPLATQLLRPEYAPPPEAYRAAVPITALAVEPQSGNILTGGYREWTLWSAQDGSLLKRLPHVTERTTTLEFSADSSLLATSGGVPGVYGEVRILDSKDYSERQLLAKTTDIVSGLAFRPDGQELAAAFPDLTVRIYELATGKERLKIESHGDRINSVHWSPDGTRLVSTSWDQTTK